MIIAISCNSITKEKSIIAENQIDSNPIEEKIKKVMEENNVPSLSIGIIQDGKTHIAYINVTGNVASAKLDYEKLPQIHKFLYL